MTSKDSQRFKSSVITAKLVPVLLVLILVGLIAVLVLIVMTLLGFTPGV